LSAGGHGPDDEVGNRTVRSLGTRR
jgi:hypothetical protein